MNHAQRKALAALPSHGQNWLCIVGRTPNWVQDHARSEPWRPAMCIILDIDNDKMLHVGLGSRNDTPARVVTRTLVEAMTDKRPSEAGMPEAESEPLTPGRPQSIEFTRDEVHRALKVDLDKLGVSSSYAPRVALVRALLRDMAAFSEEPAEPGILSILQDDVLAAQRFFAAMAAYHKAAPWELVANAHVIEVRYPPTARPFWVVILGNGGEEFGLAIYESLDVVNRMFGDRPADMRRIDHQAISVLFGDPYDGAPTEDLDAIEQFGFPVNASDAYPMLLSVRIKGGEVERLEPSTQDVDRFVALAQVLPEFVQSDVHMAAEEAYPKPAQATLMLPDGDPHASIQLKFPPDGLTFRPPMRGDEDDDDDLDWDDGVKFSEDDLLRALMQIFGGPPEPARKPASRAKTQPSARQAKVAKPAQRKKPRRLSK